MATILIADDAAFMRMRYRRLLEQRGHSVVEAADGRQAVEVYAEHRPDAVLLDITMPLMDGLEALKEIKHLDPAARVRMVTALGQQRVVMEALQAGARDFVLKPCEADRVMAAVWRLLRRSSGAGPGAAA